MMRGIYLLWLHVLKMGHQCNRATTWLHENLLPSSLQLHEWTGLWYSQRTRLQHNFTYKEAGSNFFFPVIYLEFLISSSSFLLTYTFDIFWYQIFQWANLCKAYLLEVKWYQSRYTPSLNEFLRNAWITNTGPVLIMHAYFCITNPIKEEELECLKNYPAIIQSPSLILRLANDLATSPVSYVYIRFSVQGQ